MEWSGAELVITTNTQGGNKSGLGCSPGTYGCDGQGAQTFAYKAKVFLTLTLQYAPLHSVRVCLLLIRFIGGKKEFIYLMPLFGIEISTWYIFFNHFDLELMVKHIQS